MPGRPYEGALNFTPEETELAARLRAHVEVLAAEQRNTDLERPARYIEQQLGALRSQHFQSGGRRVRNIETGAGAIVIGAHYDTVPGSPGADDNASRAGGHSRRDVVGPLVVSEPRLPGDHGDGHRLLPLSPLPSAERHAGEARLHAHGARDARLGGGHQGTGE